MLLVTRSDGQPPNTSVCLKLTAKAKDERSSVRQLHFCMFWLGLLMAIAVLAWCCSSRDLPKPSDSSFCAACAASNIVRTSEGRSIDDCCKQALADAYQVVLFCKPSSMSTSCFVA